tara:strand:+ start:2296 stop:2523 length:228 start_codon:yes stop_codon:yes gene_type:complete
MSAVTNPSNCCTPQTINIPGPPGTDGTNGIDGAIQVFSGNYGGGTPTQTPTTSAAIAYDLDAPNLDWRWDGTAWF